MKCKFCGSKISSKSDICPVCKTKVVRKKQAAFEIIKTLFINKSYQQKQEKAPEIVEKGNLLHCKYCGVDVGGGLDKCPLCHENLQEGTKDSERLYPKRKFRKAKKVFTFTSLYAFIAICVTMILIVINLFYSKYLWTVPSVILMLYGYVFVKNTVLYKGATSSKIYWQTVVLLILVGASLGVFYAESKYYFYILPPMLIASVIVQIIFLFIKHKRLHEFTVYLPLTCFLCLIPIITAYALNLDLVLKIISIACCITGAVPIIAILFFARKEFLTEFNKIFHV